MKKLVLLGCVALLASCGSKTEPAPEATTEATADAAMPMDAGPSMAASGATANGSTAGSFDTVGPDGTKGVTTTMADGTYVDRDMNDKVVAKGTWAVKDGKTCFMPEGKPEECYTESAPAADGSFTATGADGKVTKVSPHKKA